MAWLKGRHRGFHTCICIQSVAMHCLYKAFKEKTPSHRYSWKRKKLVDPRMGFGDLYRSLNHTLKTNGIEQNSARKG